MRRRGQSHHFAAALRRHAHHLSAPRPRDLLRLRESPRRPEKKFQTAGKSQQHVAKKSSARSQRDLSNFTLASPSAATACNWPGQLKWLRPSPSGGSSYPVPCLPLDPPAPAETRNNTDCKQTSFPALFGTQRSCPSIEQGPRQSTGGTLGRVLCQCQAHLSQDRAASPCPWTGSVCALLWWCSRSANGPALPFCRRRFAPVSSTSQTIIRRQRGM